MRHGDDAITRVPLPSGNASTLIADMLLCVQFGALQLLGAHDELVLNPMVARPNCRSN